MSEISVKDFLNIGGFLLFVFLFNGYFPSAKLRGKFRGQPTEHSNKMMFILITLRK